MTKEEFVIWMDDTGQGKKLYEAIAEANTSLQDALMHPMLKELLDSQEIVSNAIWDILEALCYKAVVVYWEDI